MFKIQCFRALFIGVRSRMDRLSTETFYYLLDLFLVEDIMFNLNAIYYSGAFITRNPLILEMIENYWKNLYLLKLLKRHNYLKFTIKIRDKMEVSED